MGDVLDFGEVRFGIVDAFDDEARGVADDVGVGQEPVRADEKTGAGATGRARAIPRGAVVRLDGGIFDALASHIVASMGNLETKDAVAEAAE